MVIGGTITAPRRSAAIDAVRVLGVTAVVAGHVWTESETIRALLYTWHVPVFFFLTGYLWTPRRPLPVEAAKRWRTLGLPYVAWLLLIAAVYLPWQHLRGGLTLTELAAPFVGGAYIGRPFSAFWFMGALFAAAIVYRIIQRMPLWSHWILALIGVALGYLVPDALTAVPLGAGIAIPALIFVVAGNHLKQVRSRIASPMILGGSLLAVAIAVVATRVSNPVDLKQSDLGTPILSVAAAIAISAALILLAEGIVPRLGARLGKGLVALASVGTMVILTHAVILWALGTPPAGGWPALAIALVVPWGAALIVARTPLAPFLIGSPKQGSLRIKARAAI